MTSTMMTGCTSTMASHIMVHSSTLFSSLPGEDGKWRQAALFLGHLKNAAFGHWMKMPPTTFMATNNCLRSSADQPLDQRSIPLARRPLVHPWWIQKHLQKLVSFGHGKAMSSLFCEQRLQHQKDPSWFDLQLTITSRPAQSCPLSTYRES